MSDYEQTSDIGLDLQKKADLIEKAKQINADTDSRTVKNLQKQWKRIGDSESQSLADIDLDNEFEALIDAYYAGLEQKSAVNQQAKEALIAEAKAVSTEDRFKQGTQKMEELMDSWKKAGFTKNKELDDKLWEEFRTVRKAFFDAKNEYYKKLKEQFSGAKKAKEEIIAKAEALLESEDIKKAGNEFKKLLAEWKTIGNAGRDVEQELWNKFNESRQAFFEKQNAYYEEVKSHYAENLNKKRQLISEAQEICYQEEYTKEQTARMKELQQEWKTIGFCGKEDEDKAWKNFRESMDKYFEGLRNKSNY
ncbi:MAG: DUF349 domain-containing protein [Firmicutes bacterium]|nr:DUF349 domain-containing protein [Bacillota bacterium]